MALGLTYGGGGDFLDIVKDEVNVREVILTADVDAVADVDGGADQ